MSAERDRGATSPARPAGGATVGARLGRYRIGEKIGEGGMAEVFRAALDGAEGFSRSLVIKRVRRELVSDPAVTSMFVDEARLARRLTHGNIVQVHDFGVDDEGTPYLVMEEIDGVSLDRLIERVGRLDVADALHVVERVAEALAYAHRLRGDDGEPLGVVHRDVTPRNVLISVEGVVKLADFGIAKTAAPARTLPGVIKGSVGYLSPEQAAAIPVDAKTDQFALGVVLYELFVGANPYRDVTNLERVRVTLERPLPPLPKERGVDEDLDRIVHRATAFAAGDRYESMDDLHADLQAWRVSRGYRSSERRIAELVAGTRRDAKPASISVGDLPRRATEQAQSRSPRATRWRLWAAGAAVVAAVAATLVASRVASRSDRRDVGSDARDARAERPTAPTPTPPATSVAANEPAPPAAPRAEPAPPPPAPPPASTSPRPSSPPAAVTRPAAPPAPAAITIVKSGGDVAPARQGQLKINLVPYARVTLDGIDLGVTPIDRSVAAGPHTVVLENPDTGRKSTLRIDVPGDGLIQISSW